MKLMTVLSKAMLPATLLALSVTTVWAQAPQATRPAPPPGPAGAIQAAREFDANPEAVGGIHACSDQKPVTLMNGDADNFAYNAADNNVFRSPALTKAYQGRKIRGFDQPGIDMVFGTSFRVGCCKLCQVVVQIRVRRASLTDGSDNDRAYVGFSSTGTGLAPALAVEDIWKGAYAKSLDRVVTFVINPGSMQVNSLNEHVFKTCVPPQSMPFLDVLVQDDTAVDWVRVTQFPL